MGNNNITSTNDILIKTDQNNLIFIDPNSVVLNGVAVQRSVEPENLVMYVNLEADLIPRSILASNDEKNTLLSIAKGNLNFLQNKNGKDFDTTWTDAYTEFKGNSTNDVFRQNDETGQSFGIDSISIQVGGTNFIPRVTIKFIDVRGKTLFESPENSPYKAFFHLPWPIFYLTVKGYYGKAIRYRLHLIKFNSRYDSNTGNFEIDSSFVGSTYAFMTDIPLEGILNAPYMYQVEYNEDGIKKDGYTEKRIKKSTKGYQTLKSVYQDYINKGLLPKDFPVKTLREIIITAGRLNKILEQNIFKEIIDHKALASLKEYENSFIILNTVVQGWKTHNLDNAYISNPGEPWFQLSGNDKNKLERVTGQIPGSLELLINRALIAIDNNIMFGQKIDQTLIIDKDLKTHTISLEKLKNIKNFYISGTDGAGNPVIGVDINGIFDIIHSANVDYNEQRKNIEELIETKMNNIVKDKDTGIGFEPTIRNLFGVLMANADTHIRLLKDVHRRAFDRGNDRKKILANVETDKSTNSEDIYPWPEVKKQGSDGAQSVLMYPGGKEMMNKLQSDDDSLWPEIDFVENFYQVSTKKSDGLADKEGNPENITYVFDSDSNSENKNLSSFTDLMDYIPYTDKSIISILYEIYERAKYVISFNSFDNLTINELASVEFENLKSQITEDYDVMSVLKSKITDTNSLVYNMKTYSALDKYPYFEDQLPTIPYIKESVENDFVIKKYDKTEKRNINNTDYPNLSKYLSNYTPETYRMSIYPFNSPTYLSYLKQSSFNKKNLQLNETLTIDGENGFINSPLNGRMWIKPDFRTNIFSNKIKFEYQSKSLLNTPYFHKQLYNNYTSTGGTREKYVGSAYLFLNSLPFVDLDDTISYSDLQNLTKSNLKNLDGEKTLVSTIFREVGATHFIPYHLMLKWGSIYHRYKKYIMESNDIISGITDSINTDLFFDNLSGRTYSTISGYTTSVMDVNNSTKNNIGLYPYYQNLFHDLVNGYGFYNQISTGATTGYTETITKNANKLWYKKVDTSTAWATFIDNSIYDSNDNRFTLLPSNGFNFVDPYDFAKTEQDNFRIIWTVDDWAGEFDIDYTGYTFPSYNEYIISTGGTYTLSTDYKKVIDLIATFKSDILDVFEEMFLDFASEKLNEEIPYNPLNVQYSSFQDLLKEIVSVEKLPSMSGNTIEDLVSKIKTNQISNLERLTTHICSNDNLIKFTLGNPREIDNYVLGGFTKTNSQYFPINEFNETQVTSNLNNIKLYLGEDLSGYYVDFFRINNIELNEENIKQFRTIIYVYAGLRANSITPTNDSLITYLKTNIISNQDKQLRTFLNNITSNLTNLVIDKGDHTLNIKHGYNDEPIKLELYNYFKSFNDKWVAGNSLGQRLLMEEFLFLDRANKDIGSSVYIDMTKLAGLIDPKNSKINLFNAISLLIQDSGFDIRVIPAYVNFYETTFANKRKVTPSKNVAQNMFGTFLEVDYQEASPKTILQYIGPTSKHPEMEDISRKYYMFKNDGFNVGSANNNPIIITPDIFRNTDYSKSNKVVAFEVSFGDQNQAIFKSVNLDQTTIKNTSESFKVLERLGTTETGSSTAQIDIGLFDIFRQSSYQCEVTCMGNVMIQPTMYFYLKNIPLFRGSYWITEVTHNIKSTGIETSFKGTRIPRESLPKPEDSFLASYRSFFDKLIGRAKVLVAQDAAALSSTTAVSTTGTTSGTSKTIVTNTGSHSLDMGKPVPGERLIEQVGITPYQIPYNGFGGENDIQLVTYNGGEWLRSRVTTIKVEDNIDMGIISGIKGNGKINWGNIKQYESTQSFYFSHFKCTPDYLINNFTKTEFLNPNVDIKIPLRPILTVNTDIRPNDNEFQGPVSFGPNISGCGIALSRKLMKDLSLSNGEVIYFRMIS